MQINQSTNLNSKRLLHHAAFTLAEVLITLGIIGVVAALTIPSLINNAQETQFKTAYKKAYSVASQAWTMALNDDKLIENVTGEDTQARVDNFNTFKSYFRIITDCNNNDISACWADGEKGWNSYPNSTAKAFVDASGMAWANATSNNGSEGDTLFVDINGSKKPNKYGQDRFMFEPINHLTNVGMPDTLALYGDCLSSSDCDSKNSAYVCPSVASHPCYYTSWITGAK